MMAEVSTGERNISESNVLPDSSFLDTFQRAMNECTEIRKEVDFLQIKNEFSNVSHHNNCCFGRQW